MSDSVPTSIHNPARIPPYRGDRTRRFPTETVGISACIASSPAQCAAAPEPFRPLGIGCGDSAGIFYSLARHSSSDLLMYVNFTNVRSISFGWERPILPFGVMPPCATVALACRDAGRRRSRSLVGSPDDRAASARAADQSNGLRRRNASRQPAAVPAGQARSEPHQRFHQQTTGGIASGDNAACRPEHAAHHGRKASLQVIPQRSAPNGAHRQRPRGQAADRRAHWAGRRPVSRFLTSFF